MASGIYQIRNLINGKVYIGSAGNIKERWKYHRCRLKTQRHHTEHLQRAYNKYGKENFVYEILEETKVNAKILEEREQYWMDKTKCYDGNFGYNTNQKSNSCLGSIPWNAGIPCRPETKKKISQSLRGRVPWNKGKKASLVTRQKLSLLRMGNQFSKGSTAWNKGLKMKPESPETREKKRIAAFRNWQKRKNSC